MVRRPTGRCIREGDTDADGTACFLDTCNDSIDVSVYAPDKGFLVARTPIGASGNRREQVVVDPPPRVAGSLLDARGSPLLDGILRLAPRDRLAPWTQLFYDSGSGAFECALPASEYLPVASCRGANVGIAECGVAPGEVRDLGPLRIPALATLRIEHDAAAAPDGLEL